MKQRRRPTPIPLDALEEPAGATLPALRVKNTFLEGVAQLSPSLERFYQVRAMHTCPSKQSGCIKGLFENVTSNATEASPTPLATPVAIGTPCNLETPLADEVFRAYTYQQLCELPLACPSFTVPSQAFGLPEFQYGGADVALHVVAPTIQPLLPEGHHATRPVLSLANALESAFVPTQQTGASVKPESFIPTLSDLDSHRPVVGQMPGAIAGDLALNLCAPSHPPPPPPGPALGTAELPSMGSRDHAAGCCRPCAFFHSKGCENGLACQFCHLCGPEERKRRRQEKLQERRESQKSRRERQMAQAEASE